MFKVAGLKNQNREVLSQMGPFEVVEYKKDLSVAPDNAIAEYYMGAMGVRRHQLVANMDGSAGVITQAGAMQWMAGNLTATTGVKGMGDFLGKALRSSVTKESAIKPEYVGQGLLVLEPTYKHILLQDVAAWGPAGMVIEDGMFLASEATVTQSLVARSTLSSAVAGGEGLFNLCMAGRGIVALESNVPESELVVVQLDNDVLKIDGSLAVAWSASLKFTVERSGKTLIGSAASGEGLVNVYRGTGTVLMSPVAPSSSLYAATHMKK